MFRMISMILDEKTIDEAIKLIEKSDNEYALKNIRDFRHNLSDQQLNKIFKKPVDDDKINCLFGIPVIENQYIPAGEIWMMGKDGQLLKRFKI